MSSGSNLGLGFRKKKWEGPSLGWVAWNLGYVLQDTKEFQGTILGQRSAVKQRLLNFKTTITKRQNKYELDPSPSIGWWKSNVKNRSFLCCEKEMQGAVGTFNTGAPAGPEQFAWSGLRFGWNEGGKRWLSQQPVLLYILGIGQRRGWRGEGWGFKVFGRAWNTFMMSFGALGQGSVWF